jgi:Kef-type K+ transport system membrane component KefB
MLCPGGSLLCRHCSKELVQLALVSGCLACAWLCGKLQLSEELGAFIAGAVVSLAERTLINRGYFPPVSPSASPRIGSGSSSGNINSLLNSYSQLSTSSGGSGSIGGSNSNHSHPGEGASHAGVFANIESIINVMTALFVASIGLIMSPVFLWHHLWVLLAGTVVVAAVKVVVVGAVVHMFGTPIATSAAVGLTMAHIGEFSFVLLSMANQLKLLSPQVRQEDRYHFN